MEYFKIRNKDTVWVYENGRFELCIKGKWVLSASAAAVHADGRKIDTEHAEYDSGRILEHDYISEMFYRDDSEVILELVFRDKNGLILKEFLGIRKDGIPWACCDLQSNEGMAVTRELRPLILREAKNSQTALWSSLWSKMLLVPYDNTMWSRYEAVPLRPGRESYDLTVLFSEKTREGLLVGAMDFSTWKNGICCAGDDARKLETCCGIWGKGTHDTQKHGCISGFSVLSSRFVILYGEDYRRLLEKYGDLIKEETALLTWNGEIPFGWNSWSALAFRLNEKNYRDTAEFVQQELVSEGYQNQDTVYLNMDAGWNQISEEKLPRIVRDLHEKGMKAGIYDVPFAYFGTDWEEKIPGSGGIPFLEILLKDEAGVPLERVDGAVPMDVTHPAWKAYTEEKYRKFMEWGFDYIKMDFLSHGGMEGSHYDQRVHTGRQAIRMGYQFVNEQIREYGQDREVFVSLSIAPLFPCGYGHARRFSCDSFGTDEDVEYVLNAQTYAWWQHGRLYAYNDPDHICLLRSFCGRRDSLEGEAKARYTSAVIAGTVMMLSDDYELPEARERAIRYAGNTRINQIARSGAAFCPVEASGDSASHAYTAEIDGKKYLALFYWGSEKCVVSVKCRRADIPEYVRICELWTGECAEMSGEIRWKFDGCGAAVFEVEKI